MLQLIFLIIFPFALWKAWKNIQMAKASTGWPTVSGTITASETAKVMFRKQPRVTYSYSVNGAPFTGNRISFAGGYPPKETDAILSRYPVGRRSWSRMRRTIRRRPRWKPDQIVRSRRKCAFS